MQIGDLRRRIAVLRPVISRDTFGAEEISFATATTVWGKFEELKANESYDDGQIKVNNPVKITIRYNDKITSKSRLKCNDKVYEITGINHENGLNKFTIIYAKEVTNG